nr:T9SS type A sorting domain-containing protein [Aquimarina aggregata]
MGEPAYAGYHTYGVWWKSAKELLFYLDGKFVYEVTPAANFNLPMYLRMVVETYDWNPPKNGRDGMNDSQANRTTYYDWVRSYRLVDCNSDCGNTDPDPNPSTVSIDCNSLPSTLTTGTSIQVPVSYTADQNRDVVVELWNSGWLAQGKKTVSAGSGTTTVTININNAPAAGSNYLLKASVRPVGAGWQQNIKACSKNNITLSTGTTDPDPDPDPTSPQTVSISAIDDAYLQGGTRFNSTVLRTENGKRVSYLKFDVSNISGTITDANLKLTVNGDAGNGNINVNNGNSNNWNESNLSTSNAPGTGALLGSLNKTYSLNQAQNFKLNNLSVSGNFLTLVVTQTGGNDVSFASDENQNGKPVLTITYNTTADPVPNSDPNRDAVSIDCNSLPSTLTTGTSIQVPVTYSADQNRDVVVELWNSGWLGQGRKTVSAGSGTTTVTINLNNAPAAGSNYLLKGSIRPVGAGWQQNIKACSKNNITLSTGTTDPDPTPTGGACNTTNKVTGLNSTGNTNNSVTIAFNQLSGVKTYELRAFKKGTFTGNINGADAYKSGASSPLTIGGLNAGTEYTFVIRALCNSGGPTPTSQVNASTSGTGGGNGGDGTVGEPDNGGDSGCTGRDTFDQGVKIVPNANSWKDSYKANGYCFCKSSFDHGVGNFKITINGQRRNIRDVCDELKKHPKFRDLRNGDPRYNTIQCGNEPGHGDAITIQGKRIKDEKVCPGRVDQGSKGCKCKGPKYDMKWLSSRSRFGGNGKDTSISKSDSFSIYPNPVNANGESFLNIYSDKNERARISIHNLSGQIIASMNYDGAEGTTSAIEITSLIEAASSAKGVYFISYKTRSVSMSKTLVIK